MTSFRDVTEEDILLILKSTLPKVGAQWHVSYGWKIHIANWAEKVDNDLAKPYVISVADSNCGEMINVMLLSSSKNSLVKNLLIQCPTCLEAMSAIRRIVMMIKADLEQLMLAEAHKRNAKAAANYIEEWNAPYER